MTTLFRRGAEILFVLSLIVFAGMLAYQFVLIRDLYQQAAMGNYQGTVPSVWIEMVAVISGSLSSAAVPFFGACVINRADRILAIRKEAAE